jgi:hypothetical protein
MVWQRFAKSPRIARAGSTPAASAKSRTCSSAESERDSAKVEVARSNRARSTNSKILRSGRAGKARVSETRLRRFESYLRSQFEKFDAEYTGVVKPPGTDS